MKRYLLFVPKDGNLDELLTVNELFERFVKEYDYKVESNTDVSSLNIEIEGFDFETNEKTWEKINNLLIKSPVD